MSKLRNEAPIGVFDSGLGGLTVLKALAARLPREDFVYLADTARAPYGPRTAQTIKNYTHACAPVLRDHRIKLLVVSSHSVSSVAIDGLAGELFVPAVGAVVPSARAALRASARKRIGVLACASTLRSGAYPRAVAELDAEAHVFVQTAALLGPLAVEGWIDDETARLATRAYLAPLIERDIDVLVLGSADFSVFEPLVSRELAALSGKPIPIIDSAPAVAEAVALALQSRQIETAREDPGKLRIIVTDMPDDFASASRFLGQELSAASILVVDV
jgi:glutamate racemase